MLAKDLEKGPDQIHALAEIAEFTKNGGNLSELLRHAADLIVKHLRFEHAAVFLLTENGDFAVLQATSGACEQIQNLDDYRLPVDSASLIGWVAIHNQPKVMTDANQETPLEKSNLFPPVSCNAGIPISMNGKLLGVLCVKHYHIEAFDTDALATLQAIANLIATFIAQHRLFEATQNHLRSIEKRLLVLEALELVNKTISGETNLDNLFKLIHEQVVRVTGEVNFLIALCSKEHRTIEIPFAYENGNHLDLPPSPVDQGLISLVVKGNKPLMLVKDVEHHVEELGVHFVGKSAKSWLGVPLLVSNEAIGAIVVQDMEREQRFDEDDQRLLSSLATQVAVAIRNALQLEKAHHQAVRERAASEITTKLWSSTDIHTILRTAIHELSQFLEADEGIIQLHNTENLQISTAPANNGHEGGTA